MGFRRWRELKAGRRVSLSYVRKRLTKVDAVQFVDLAASNDLASNANKNLTVESLVELVPNLSKQQASRILHNSEVLAEEKTTKALSMSHALNELHDIGKCATSMHTSLQQCIHMKELFMR